MSILPQGYANAFTPVFETNQTPDAINVINGSEGIIATRVGNTVNLTTGVLNATSPFSVQSPDETKSFTIIQNNDGTDLLNTYDGSINVASSQASPDIQLSMGINPFTGTCYIANTSPNTLNGNIQLICSDGPISGVDVVVQPGAGNAGGITIYNGSVAGPSCNIDTSASGTMELSGSNGNIELIGNCANLQGAIFTPATGVGAGGFTIQNGNTGPAPETSYTVYNSTLDGGGLTAGNLEIFGYSGSGPTIRRCLTTNAVGSTMTLGDDSTVGGASVNIAGSLGLSRVFDNLYYQPNNIITFDTQTPVLSPSLAMGDFGSGNYGNFLIKQANSNPVSFVMPVIKSGCNRIVVSVNVPGAGFSSGPVNSMGYLDLFDATTNIATGGRFYSAGTPAYFPTTQAPGANWQQNLTMTDVFPAPIAGNTIEVRLWMVRWGNNLGAGITLYNANCFAIVKVEPAINAP